MANRPCVPVPGAVRLRAIICAAIGLAMAAIAPPSHADPNAADYKLGPGDEIRVIVYGETDLSVEEQRVSARGDIVMPLIGEVEAAGATTSELAHAIEERLRQGYLKQPRVSVSALTYRPFYVVGEVARPGPYPYTPTLSVAGAVATAGGFTRNSVRRHVYVRREGELREIAYPIDSNLVIRPGDTIRVGENALSTIRDLPLGLIGLIP